MSLKNAVYIQVLINIVSGVSLDQMFSTMLIFQFVVCLLLVNIQLPEQTRKLMAQINELANLDILSKFETTTHVFGSYISPEMR